jgi:hypothetical protein
MSNLYDDATFDAAYQACADVRDSYPRNADDAPSEEVVDAILDAVAPLIAAKELRDGQAEHERKADQASNTTARTLHLCIAECFRNRADEIERGE